MGLAAPLISRGDVHYVRLDPTHGSELRKTRPCVVVSPDELNHHLRTVIVAPMTTSARAYPWLVPCRFRGRKGVVALDQIRAIDAERLGKSSESSTLRQCGGLWAYYWKCSTSELAVRPNRSRMGETECFLIDGRNKVRYGYVVSTQPTVRDHVADQIRQATDTE